MTAMQRRRGIGKPIDEEIDILTWLPKSGLNFQVHHGMISEEGGKQQPGQKIQKFPIQIDRESKVGGKINNNQLTKSITGRNWGGDLKAN